MHAHDWDCRLSLVYTYPLLYQGYYKEVILYFTIQVNLKPKTWLPAATKVSPAHVYVVPLGEVASPHHFSRLRPWKSEEKSRPCWWRHLNRQPVAVKHFSPLHLFRPGCRDEFCSHWSKHCCHGDTTIAKLIENVSEGAAVASASDTNCNNGDCTPHLGDLCSGHRSGWQRCVCTSEVWRSPRTLVCNWAIWKPWS